MFKLLFYLHLIFLIKETVSRNTNWNGTFERIVGGSVTTVQRHPWQAAIYIRRNQRFAMYCGGSILSQTFVLTAAHCMEYQDKVIVRVGASHRREMGTRRYATPIMHPKFDSHSLEYDIGLAKMDKPIKLDGVRTRTVILPNRNENLADNQRVVVTGWGRIRETGPLSRQLREVTVSVINHKTCEGWYSAVGDVITEDMICAGLPEGRRAPCRGDSGGPLVIRGGRRLVGVVSFSAGCARPKLPAVFANVIYFRDWINEKTGL